MIIALSTGGKMTMSKTNLGLPPSTDKALEALASRGGEEGKYSISWMESQYGYAAQQDYNAILTAVGNLKEITNHNHMAPVHAALHKLEQHVLDTLGLHEFIWDKGASEDERSK
jgi:hypothetical protein